MEYVRTLSLSLDVGERVELGMENRAGRVSVRGEDTKQVQVEVIARLWAESEADADDQAEEIARGIVREGGRLTIRAPALDWRGPIFFGRGPRIEYRITVPRATSAHISNRSGHIEIDDLAGTVDVESRSGRVDVTRVGGNARIDSRSGGVHAEGIGGSLTVDSRSGGVQVRKCGGDATVLSRSGSVRVEEVAGSLKIECRSGSLNIAAVGGALKAQTRSGSLRYEGEVSGPFDIDIRSGSVLLAVDPEARFFLDAETTSGSVRSDLPVRTGAGRPAADGPRVRVRIRSGSIRIVPR